MGSSIGAPCFAMGPTAKTKLTKAFFPLAVMAAVTLVPVQAWATAAEEPGKGLDAVNAISAVAVDEAPSSAASGLMTGKASGEPVQISEVPTAPYFANNASSIFRQRAYTVASYINGYNKRLAMDEANAIAEVIVQYSSRYGVDYRLLTSLIAIESAFRRDAVSSSGAIGMGQLKPNTAKWLGVVNPYDSTDNIAGTARFLGWLLRKYNGNLELALSAYYQGPGFVDKNGIAPVCMPYLEKINRALGGLL